MPLLSRLRVAGCRRRLPDRWHGGGVVGLAKHLQSFATAAKYTPRCRRWRLIGPQPLQVAGDRPRRAEGKLITCQRGVAAIRGEPVTTRIRCATLMGRTR